MNPELYSPFAKAYIGDSVYARIGEVGQLTLTTENGNGPTNVIILEPEVWRDLIAFCRRNWAYEHARHDAEVHEILNHHLRSP